MLIINCQIMKKTGFFVILLITQFLTQAQTLATPDKIYAELFTDVQQSGIFPDSKTFVDAVPKKDPAIILKAYREIKANPAIRFSLELFVKEHFLLPEAPQEYNTPSKDIVQHIQQLWTVLKRQKDQPIKGSSLIPLPHPYIVPGGRFREIYYWDSFFTMLGLKESGECGLMEDMVKNFAYLIQQHGHIPNGNRTYYLSRSQPPFFAHMVMQLCLTQQQALARYYPAIEKEYRYWMEGATKLGAGQRNKRVVRMDDGSLLNRYWDDLTIPRQESYLEDVKTADTAISHLLQDSNFTNATQQQQVIQNMRSKIYLDLRAAAASGWDFSSRWFADGQTLSTIYTTDIVPVDLNCLLILSETLVSKYSKDPALKRMATNNLSKRIAAIRKYCWNEKAGYFTDHDLNLKAATDRLTLAGVFPLYFWVADFQQAVSVQSRLQNDFLKAGGFITSLTNTGEQWDAPNGWAPLQWITVQGLKNYGFDSLATMGAKRWIQLNIDVYNRTGRLMEKYNVVNTSLKAGGGEYPSQDGFGWTNGVLLALIKQYGRSN